MRFNRHLGLLIRKKNLPALSAERLFLQLFKNQMTFSESAAFLILLARKQESAGELQGCLKALRRLEKPRPALYPELMDNCGTGGDGFRSLNISTLSSFVIAGAGGKVAKHGNRSISSRCGSSDLMEALGIKLEASPKTMIRSIRENNIGYFHAPYYHPVFARIQPLRKSLKIRTIFNLLGPLVNPFDLKRQMIGVSSAKKIALYAQVLALRKPDCALVCSAKNGMDELSLNCESRLAWIKKGRIQYTTLNPQQFGLKKAAAAAYKGGSVRTNRAAALRLLQGRVKGPLRDIILLNSAAGLVVSGIASSWAAGLKQAKQSLDKGWALKAFLGLRQLTRKES